MIERVYDEIAGIYDSLYEGPQYEAENTSILHALQEYAAQGTVLDVGCGTGLLLDLLPINRDRYFGIDPSRKMLAILMSKHPGYAVSQETFEDYWLRNDKARPVDLLVALFGTGSYVSPTHYEALSAASRHYLIMFYKEGYRPGYEPDGATFTDYEAVNRVFGPVQEWGNYLVATNTGEVLR